MTDEYVNEISENMILNNQSLFDYYFKIYNRYYLKEKEEWDSNFNKKEIIDLFESISLNNRRKFRLYSIIQLDVTAFHLLTFESEIIKNDEEIVTYVHIYECENAKYDDLRISFKIEIEHLRKIIYDQEKDIKKLKEETQSLRYSTNRIKKGYW